ncbi:hypothetical protein BJY01DRAFT_35463 [Aspergillus pseudoustus]|uniref:DNA replication regulator SLD2 n=1 Tax=Aspergillus pseudoustus TaxID=1810923 RepID=A0ABR4JDY7_9EURO
MPRTLPWLTGVVKTRNSPIPETKRVSSARVKTETPSKKQPSTSRRDFLRSSPSPPSSPIHRCPPEEFLQEGLDKDDIYIMVEDEFYTIAQSFTQHLHYAEYIRRGREAKLQNAAKIEDIARPTDSVTPMSEALKKKYAAEELRTRQRDGVGRLDGNDAHESSEKEAMGDDIEEENSWAGTHLQDLMLSPRRVRSLVGLQGIRSSTRAAAGFAQGPGPSRREVDSGDQMEEIEKEPSLPDETTADEDDDDDDDDLDAVVSRPAREVSRSCTAVARPYASMSTMNALPAKSVSRLSSNAPPSTSDTKRGSHVLKSENKVAITTLAKNRLQLDDFDGFTSTPEVTRSEDNRLTTTQVKKRLAFDDFDELPELRRPSIQPQRRQSGASNVKYIKPKDNNTGSKKSRLNEVPTFLI